MILSGVWKTGYPLVMIVELNVILPGRKSHGTMERDEVIEFSEKTSKWFIDVYYCIK